MISLDEAKVKATEYNNVHNSDICQICDAGHGWIFSFYDVDSKEELDMSPIYVAKESGKVEVYFPPDHLNDNVKIIFSMFSKK